MQSQKTLSWGTKKTRLHWKYALAKKSDPALTHFNFALVYQEQGNRPAALASVRKALEARPGYREARKLEKSLLAAP